MRGIAPGMALLLAMLAIVAGCSNPPAADHEHHVNRWTTKHYTDQAVRNGIIAQQTLHPHHFVAHAAALNDLGEHDLRVLAEHYAEHGGRLNVRRGNADEDIYEQRLTFVRRRLVDAGVDAHRVELADEMPGGPGMGASHYLTIIDDPQARPLYPASDADLQPRREGAIR